MARKSDDLGRAFEEAGENKLRVLHQKGVVAWWEHAQPELFSLGVVRRGARVIQAWGKGKPSGADFNGILGPQSGCTGLGFAVEFKSLGPDASLVLEDEDHFSPRQRAHLTCAADAGALSLLAVQFRLADQPWITAVIQWRDLPWEKAKKHHHLRAEACARWRIPTGSHLFEHLLGGYGEKDLGVATIPF